MKTWQKIRRLRAELNAVTPEQYALLEKDKQKEYRDLELAERLFTYRYDFLAFILEVMEAESKGDPPCKLSKMHRELCRFLRSAKNLNRNTLVKVPRFHLKTQICTIYFRIWRVLNDPNLCALIVSGTLELSKSTARAIKFELENNLQIRKLYPRVVPDWLANDRKNKWSETQFSVARDQNHPQCSIEAVGAEATVTGKHFGEITMDDMVTPENSTTPEQCEKIIQSFKYFISVVNPRQGRFQVTGTPYTDSDLYNFLEEPDVKKSFMTFVRPVYDELNQPIWPQMYTKEKLRSIAAQQGPYTFATQYLLDPVPEDQMEFKKNWIQLYQSLPQDVNNNEIYVERKIIVDPITAKKITSASKDRGVVFVVGRDKAGQFYCLDYELFNRATEAQLFKSIFKMSDRHSTTVVGWETVAYQLQGKHNLEEVAKRTGKRLTVVELKPRGVAKDIRIRRLIPYFERGQIYIKAWMTELMQELYRFPHGQTMDILDCLSYTLDMFPVRKNTWRSRTPGSALPQRPFYT